MEVVSASVGGHAPMSTHRRGVLCLSPPLNLGLSLTEGVMEDPGSGCDLVRFLVQIRSPLLDDIQCCQFGQLILLE